MRGIVLDSGGETAYARDVCRQAGEQSPLLLCDALGRRAHAFPRRQGKHHMLRRCLPESRPHAQRAYVVPQRGHLPTLKRSWWLALGAALLCVLRLAWTAPGDAVAEPVGFANNCSGFAQDPLFGPLWPGTAAQKGGGHSSALA